MNSISIESIDPSDASARAPDIARTYADVFSTPPWNEAFACSECGKTFGRGAVGATCCGTLRECFPLPETSEEIRRYFGLTRARVSLALAGDATSDVVGFAWGWQDTLRGLNEEKFGLDQSDLERLSVSSGFAQEDDLFYFSEFGVTDELRGRGIGKRLSAQLFSSIAWETARGIIMRTSMQSPAYSIVTDPRNPSLMEVVYEYRDALERVILCRSKS